MAARAEGSETDALLQSHHSSSTLPYIEDEAFNGPRKGRYMRRGASIFALCLLLLTTGDFATGMVGIPLTRVYESIACSQYYKLHDPSRIAPGTGEVPEEWCKVAPVQAEVALIRGYEALFVSIPGVLLAVPYGLLADKWGRKPVVLLSLLGFLLSTTCTLVVCRFWQFLPLRLVWLSPIFTIIGGGAPVLFSMTYTIIADVVPENERATAFFQVMTGAFIAQIASTTLSSALMENHSPWLPIELGYISMILAALMGSFLSETSTPHNPTPNNIEGLSSQLPVGTVETAEVHTVPTSQDDHAVGSLAKVLQLWTSTTAFVRQELKLIMLILTFFINTVEEPTSSLTLQYISERYHLSLSRAGFVISIKAVATIIVYVLVLPGASWLLQQKFHLSEKRKDMFLARFSVIFLSLGFFIAALSPTVFGATAGFVVSTLGKGYGNIIRSLVTSLVPPGFIARLYTMITVVETFGLLLSGPLLAALFRAGLSQEDPDWLGLPFLVAGGMAALVAALIWFIDLQPRTLQS
ncbi:MFS transporter-10 [Coleophoma cylindrospora]|uniref:MFS transporter-10 n=1 Tax=Coleophoma cylindrospora TaxID=1849047 RepID=A0A3D8QAE3_9HELO|nr:MFS transporter-10 [Coleophoma cylindrospora]